MNVPRHLGAVLPLLVPWTVLVIPDAGGVGIELVFAWGLVDPDLLHVVWLSTYLFEHTAGLPDYLLAWPIGVALYGLALGNVVAGVAVDREDRRLTAGLLVLAGLSHLQFAMGFGARGSRVAIPIATALLWVLAWWCRPSGLFR